MEALNVKQYLRSMELKKNEIESFSKYPFCLPVVRNLEKLEFHPKVTFFVGENGSGKSTILEAIAVALGFNPEGGSINFDFSSRDTHSELYNYIKLIKGVKRPKDGFFLRAESFYNFETNLEELDRNVPGMFKYYGGESLHKKSHGESFFAVFMERFRGNGIYILDEPEAALSPSRQMAMIVRMHELLKNDSQFIIATHSPILTAYPDAIIYEIKNGIKKVNYEDTENYTVMKSFINDREKMLKWLLK